MEIIKRPEIDIDYDHVIKEDTLGVLKDFESVLKDKVLLELFYRNCNTLVLDGDSEELRREYHMAEYDIVQNKIFYNPELFKDAIMHELFHLSSSIVIDNRIFTGIMQMDLDTGEVFGIGANEALTCLLDDKYFKDYTETKGDSLKYSYHILKKIMEYIPILFGDEEVEYYYMSADLSGFLEMLSRYVEPNKALSFMMALDNIHGCAKIEMDKGYLGPIATKILFDNYRYAMDVVGEMYMTAVFMQYYENNISGEELDDCLGNINHMINSQLRCTYLPFIKSKKYKPEELEAFNLIVEKKVIKKYT